jgi:hypothetical protein
VRLEIELDIVSSCSTGSWLARNFKVENLSRSDEHLKFQAASYIPD